MENTEDKIEELNEIMGNLDLREAVDHSDLSNFGSE
jgi:hypothetical protein